MGNSFFKLIILITVFLYRLTQGRLGGRMMGMPVLLLTTTGRKSQKKRTIPIVYLKDGANYVITASAAAVLNRPAGWLANLKSHPQATIQVKAVQRPVVATVAEPEARSRLWAQLLAIAPGYGDYQKRLTRDIPMVILRLSTNSRSETKATPSHLLLYPR